MTIAEADLARRHAAAAPVARPTAARPAGAIAGSSRSTAADRRRRAVERPVEPAERDHRRADRALREHDDLARGSGCRRRPRWRATRTRRRWRRATSSRLHSTGFSRSRVASYCSACRRVRRATKRSIVQPARPNSRSSLRGRRIDREPVGVVGVALRAAHLLGVAVAPDRALAQQPVRRQPRAAEHERRPPRVRERAPPRTRGRRSSRPGRSAMKSIEIDSGGPVMPRSKSRATVRSLGERRILEVAHARRAHARLGQPVVEPRRGAVAEVGADRLMDRRRAPGAGRRRRRRTRAGRRGCRRAAPRRRARPWRSANTAGSTPRRTSTTHQATASGRSAFGRTPKNFHSLRSRRRCSITSDASYSPGHAAEL